MRQAINHKKYILAFIITSLIFLGALLVSNRFSEKRLAEIKSIENKIALDILSSETQFALLRETPCRAIDHSTAFSEEIGILAQKLSDMENDLGTHHAEVLNLKKYYSLLQIKDYLLVRQVDEKCGIKPVTIIYFYSNQENCLDCKKEGYALDKIREEFSEIRIYSFDYNLESPVIQTMKSLYSIENTLPALVIEEEVYYGFKDVTEIEDLIPVLKSIREQREEETER